MDAQLRKRLIHTAIHYPCINIDGYGDKTFGLPVDRSCYKEGKISVVRSVSGDEVISSLRLYFDGIFPISGHDKMALNGVDYPVLAFSQFDGLYPGTGTTVVYL